MCDWWGVLLLFVVVFCLFCYLFVCFACLLLLFLECVFIVVVLFGFLGGLLGLVMWVFLEGSGGSRVGFFIFYFSVILWVLLYFISNIETKTKQSGYVSCFVHFGVLSTKCSIQVEGNVLFNDALNTFYFRLYGVGHMVKDHTDSERGNPLPPHGLLFPISSKGSFICTIPKT